MKKEEKTIKKIQELVPEIMELKFGCRMRGYDRDFVFSHFRKDGKERGFFAINIKEDRIDEIRPYYADEDFNYKQNIGYSSLDIFLEDRFKILGRDITLEDVLLAIKRNNKALAIDSRGDFLTIKNSVDWYHNGFQWQLNKPFHEQSQKVKDFIGDLLLDEQ